MREKMQRKSKKGLTIRKKESIIHEVKQRRSSASHLIAWANRVNTVSKAGVYSVFLCAADFFRRFFFLRESACGDSIFGRCLTITELMINEQIRDKEIRLVDENGEQLGIVSSKEAQKIADEKKLDLVKIAPTAKPPVCRIMDYGKYKFDQAKKEKEARKKQKTVDVKELRLSPSIDTHDIQVKIKKANEFLKDGDKVKVSIRFRGREIGHSKAGMTIMENFAKATEEFGVIDKQPKMEGKSLVMFLAPKG